MPPNLFLAGAIAVTMLRAPTNPAAVPLLDGDIRALAAAGDRVAVIRGDQVVVLRASGEVLGRLDHDHGPAPAAAKKRRPSADEVLDLAGIPDDDLQGDLAEETLDDEGSSAGASRRRPRAADLDDAAARSAIDVSGPPRLLAASDGRIWIGGADGLSVLVTDGDTPALPLRALAVGPRRFPISALAVAPGGADLAALAGNHVFRSSDAGASWSLLAVLPARARAIEISADGRDVYLLDDEGVAVVAHHQRTFILAGRAYSLARCGSELLILGEDGVAAWRIDGGLEMRSARLPVRRLACGDTAPGVVLALGEMLLASYDGGRTWRARDDVPALAVESVAITRERVWLGTDSGLYVIPVAAPPGTSGDEQTSAAAPPAIAAAIGGGSRAVPSFLTPSFLMPSFPSGRANAWAGLFPRVSLVAAASATRPGGDRTEIWLLVTFPLGRARARDTQALRIAADRLRRRAADSLQISRLARAAAADEEAAALLRVAQASLDAVR